VLPPSDTEPPPERPVPAPTVSDGFDSMVLVTPLLAMFRVPLVVMGPPVSPAPVPTLLTVPVPGNVCPDTKVKSPEWSTLRAVP
jgi:hypothetical protein